MAISLSMETIYSFTYGSTLHWSTSFCLRLWPFQNIQVCVKGYYPGIPGYFILDSGAEPLKGKIIRLILGLKVNGPEKELPKSWQVVLKIATNILNQPLTANKQLFGVSEVRRVVCCDKALRWIRRSVAALVGSGVPLRQISPG